MVESKIMISKIQDGKIDLLLWAVFLIGIFLRFLPGLLAGFPLNDGGMILNMIHDLRSNQFLLPSTTSYNFSEIPFAYPPFGMYVAALLSSVLFIPEIEVLHWLPALISGAAIPVFYWLSSQILNSKPKAVIVTALYALMPGSFDWLVMGGGLTRSFGILFSLLAFGHVYLLFRDGGWVRILVSILFCALAVLSHPEVGLQSAGICFLIWLMYGRNFMGLKNAILVVLGTALLTAPWWLTVLLHHGLAPFESAVQTGVRETLLASLFHSIFSTQGGLPILPILSLAGMTVFLRKREFLLPCWAFLPFFVDPRNAPAVAIFPLVMLAGEGLFYLKEEFDRAYLKTMQNRGKTIAPAWLTNGMFATVLFYFLIVSYSSRGNVVRLSLTEADRETMEWVRTNTPAESRFLLITNTGQISPMTDSYQEWFPVLAERKSQNTLQGQEWTLGLQFYPYSQKLVALQACSSVECLHEWVARNSVEFDFLLIQKRRASSELIMSMRTEVRYRVIYESDNAVIFVAD